MPDRLEISFNSKLVRLKVIYQETTQGLYNMFQFQIGAIKSIVIRKCLSGQHKEFQFQIGAIKSYIG